MTTAAETTTGSVKTTPTTTAPTGNPATGPATLATLVVRRLTTWLAWHSIGILRASVGLVFLGFGALKFVPGASPAEGLVARTLETLSFGILSGQAALLTTAVVECFIGITLVTGRLLRIGLVVMAGSLVGIMSPLVLFFSDLFPGTPTLEAQYVLKDIVLVAAGLVIAARALGARLVTGETAQRS
jgi:putative oxidoreductase